MRLIGELKNLSHTKKFAAYLVTLNITPKVEPEGDSLWEIWVKEEDEQERALEELNLFLSDPDHERYAKVMEKAASIAREEDEKRKQYRKNLVQSMQPQGIAGAAPLTVMLIFLCCIVALMTSFGEADMGENSALQALSFTSVEPEAARKLLSEHDAENPAVRLSSIKSGEVWRLVTPIFIHFGALHIVFNMLWLYQFGKIIEPREGVVWFAFIVLAVAAISNLFQCLVPVDVGGSIPMMAANQHLIMPLGGMSGVVYGLFGYIVVKQFWDPSSGMALPQSTIVLLTIWIFVGGFVFGGVANWAHGVGLVVGILCAYIPLMFRGGTRIHRAS